MDAGTAPERLKTVAEDTFLRFAVGLDAFLSDWYIGAINHDASAFRRDLERRLTDWLDSAVRGSPHSRLRGYFQAPTVPIGTYPPGKTIRELIDPSEQNIEFRDFDDLVTRANRQLVQSFRTRVHQVRVAGGPDVVDATVAIRNVLAHRSENSVRRMNAVVGAMPSYPALRKPTMSRRGIGTYLKAVTGAGGEARLVLFKRELAGIAAVLTV